MNYLGEDCCGDGINVEDDIKTLQEEVKDLQQDATAAAARIVLVNSSSNSLYGSTLSSSPSFQSFLAIQWIGDPNVYESKTPNVNYYQNDFNKVIAPKTGWYQISGTVRVELVGPATALLRVTSSVGDQSVPVQSWLHTSTYSELFLASNGDQATFEFSGIRQMNEGQATTTTIQNVDGLPSPNLDIWDSSFSVKYIGN